MLKLVIAGIAGAEKRTVFINPKLVTSISERSFYDPRIERAEKGSDGMSRIVKGGYRVEGCVIEFGGPEDSGCAVMESAADVAEAVADALGDAYGGGIVVDVAERVAEKRKAQAERAAEYERRKEAQRETGQPVCPGADCPGCDACLPF